MKKIFIVLAALVLFAGCDDGDMTFKTFNFSDGNNPAFCPDDHRTVFQINGTEVLLLKLATPLLKVSSPRNADGSYIPTAIAVSNTGSNKMFYRNYSSTPNSSTFCSSSGTPNIIEEWTSSGTVLITTVPVTDVATGAVTGYQYQIAIQSATFNNGEQEVTITDNVLGAFTENYDFNFTFPATLVNRCVGTNNLYKINRDEALQIFLEDSSHLSGSTQLADLILGDATEANAKMYFRKFASTISTNNVCDITPNPVAVEQFWSVSSGKLRFIPVESADAPGVYDYEVRLYNAIFRNENSPTEFYSPANTGTDTDGAGFYLVGTVNN